MGMKENPGSGYVLTAPQAILLLHPTLRRKAEILFEEGDWEKLGAYLSSRMPNEIPKPADVFICDDDFASDELEKGEMYVRWDEDDLYIRTDTPGLVAIRNSLGIIPQPVLWTVYG